MHIGTARVVRTWSSCESGGDTIKLGCRSTWVQISFWVRNCPVRDALYDIPSRQMIDVLVEKMFRNRVVVLNGFAMPTANYTCCQQAMSICQACVCCRLRLQEAAISFLCLVPSLPSTTPLLTQHQPHRDYEAVAEYLYASTCLQTAAALSRGVL
jgi:hypothetical protein